MPKLPPCPRREPDQAHMNREQIAYALICYAHGRSSQWIADRIGFSRTAVDHQLSVHGVAKRSHRMAHRERRVNQMNYLSGMSLELGRDLPTATNPLD